jgi:hypothetical protein
VLDFNHGSPKNSSKEKEEKPQTLRKKSGQKNQEGLAKEIGAEEAVVDEGCAQEISEKEARPEEGCAKKTGAVGGGGKEDFSREALFPGNGPPGPRNYSGIAA